MYVLLLAVVCYSANILGAFADFESDDALSYFEDFIIEFNKQYADEDEKAARFEIFKANLEHINRLNEESEHAVFDITPFTDLTREEFLERHTGLRTTDIRFCEKMLHDGDIPDADAPESWDWRDHGIVTPVKDQSTCGSCWAFSATGNIEGQHAIKHNNLLSFSEQQIIDCDHTCDGCRGGLPAMAMKAVIEMGGVMLEKDYPYEAVNDICRFDLKKAVVKVTDCFSFNLTSQEKVKELLYKNGPISIAIRASGVQHHGRGIISDEQCSIGSLDHAVLLVGYGTENNIPYWLVKNSWGQNWGESGYFRMARTENIDGACAMLNANMATSVVE